MHPEYESEACQRAVAEIDEGSLADTLCRLIDTASPTGEEGPLAREILQVCDELGIDSEELALDDRQSSALGRMGGAAASSPKNARGLMLYAPIDTVTSNSAAEDLPWVGPEFVDELKARSRVSEGIVYGLGAHNPKGHGACILEAARALKASGIELAAPLLLGFGAGGMPTNARPGMRADSGHGAGCAHMLEFLDRRGEKPASAVIAKSGWSVSWEEVGFHWFEVRVKGLHNYAGSRHLMPYENPILDAARLMQKLDDWLQRWPQRHRSGLVAPQGVISFIESGWERMPAFTPALCRFRVDLRLSPRTDPDEAEREFAEALELFSQELSIQTSYQRLVTIPGTSTAQDAQVIRHCIQAWETVEGTEHQPFTGMSGGTDANILRAQGVETARIGMPKAPLENMDFQLGMNAVAVADMVKLTKVLIQVAIASCGLVTGDRAHG